MDARAARRLISGCARLRAVDSDVALFGHGHVLRVLVARWIGLPAAGGQHFLLGTGTLCVPGQLTTARAIDPGRRLLRRRRPNSHWLRSRAEPSKSAHCSVGPMLS